jgi:hypothetical protein
VKRLAPIVFVSLLCACAPPEKRISVKPATPQSVPVVLTLDAQVPEAVETATFGLG